MSEPPRRPTQSPPPYAGGPSVYQVQGFLWLCAGVTCALIGIRFVLKLLGADPAAAFVSLVYGITDPVLEPFRGIFGQGAVGRFVFEPIDVVALVIYLLLGWGVVRLVGVLGGGRQRQPTR